MTQQPIEILLVEDDPDDAELTVRGLKESNVANHLELVTDGAQALDFLFSKGAYATQAAGATIPKVVLLDIKLPKVSGLEVLREIKADARTRNIPVVMLTDLFGRGSRSGGLPIWRQQLHCQARRPQAVHPGHSRDRPLLDSAQSAPAALSRSNGEEAFTFLPNHQEGLTAGRKNFNQHFS